jgi:hypothetical protein
MGNDNCKNYESVEEVMDEFHAELHASFPARGIYPLSFLQNRDNTELICQRLALVAAADADAAAVQDEENSAESEKKDHPVYIDRFDLFLKKDATLTRLKQPQHRYLHDYDSIEVMEELHKLLDGIKQLRSRLLKQPSSSSTDDAKGEQPVEQGKEVFGKNAIDQGPKGCD